MTYPHAALIRAWLDGATLQYKEGDLWLDCEHVSVASKLPHLYRDGTDYRLKPVTYRYRVWLCNATGKLKVASSLKEETVANSLGATWIADWVTVEMP